MRYNKFSLSMLLCGLLVLLMSSAVVAQETPRFQTLTGTVSYLPRIALPDDAEIVVELADISLADAAAKVIASQRITANGRQVPFAYALTYETASITDSGRYAVNARIYVGGVLAWTSDTVTPVITNGEQTADINVVQVQILPGPQDISPVMGHGTVTGMVTYLQRIALPDDAVILVELLDISRADAPAFVLASQQWVSNGRQVPLPFALNYDLASVPDSATVSVSARILLDGELAWISDTVTPIITNDVLNVEVLLVPVR